MSSQWVFDSENFSSVVVETMMSENRRKFRFFILSFGSRNVFEIGVIRVCAERTNLDR
jgi:hypothetical protein